MKVSRDSCIPFTSSRSVVHTNSPVLGSHTLRVALGMGLSHSLSFALVSLTAGKIGCTLYDLGSRSLYTMGPCFDIILNGPTLL